VGKTCKIPPGQFREIKMAIFKIIKMKRKYELIEVLNALFERCENAHDGEYYRKEFHNCYQVEEFFVEYCLGVKGVSSKVMGNVLLVWYTE
jgi:hypothetical protein